MRRSVTVAFLILLVFLASVPRAARAQNPAACFPETGYCMDGDFMDYWNQHGGLPVFGFPIGNATQDQDGVVFQYFERTVFEWTPQNPRPYHVSLFRMGDIVLQERGFDWQSQPGETQQYSNCLWFEQTKFNVCDYDDNAGFREYWRTHGLEFDGKPGKSYAESLALFGLPLTEDFQDVDTEGNPITVQWFERARFEWHPRLAGQQRILLGLLGREYLDSGN